ncbi:MAG: hypothetical protein AB7T38_18715 [Nitrospirales bacterium]
MFTRGVAADVLELDYGWMYPGETSGSSQEHRIHLIKQFLEKSFPDEAQKVMDHGVQWNI